MTTFFNDFLQFFGITGSPQNMTELIPWLLSVFSGLFIVLVMFGFIFQMVRGLNR